MRKYPPWRLQVELLEDVEVFIDHHDAVETFLEAIDRIGIEKVRALGIVVDDFYVNQLLPLVVTKYELNAIDGRFQDYYKPHTNRKHWIHTQTNTSKKRELLEEIAERGDIEMNVKVVPK